MDSGYPRLSERETDRMRAHRAELVERIALAVPVDGMVEPLKGVHLRRASTRTEPCHGVSETSF